jgi:flagellar biosynthesis anti-sigma factor FlgM
MKIDSDQLLSTVNKFRNDQPEKVDPSVVNGKKNGVAGPGVDRVDISAHKAELDQLKTTMQGISDVRSEKVARLKEEIAAGTYRVDGTEIATRMLDRWRELHGK